MKAKTDDSGFPQPSIRKTIVSEAGFAVPSFRGDGRPVPGLSKLRRKSKATCSIYCVNMIIVPCLALAHSLVVALGQPQLSALSCPAKCLCTEVGAELRVDCSGQNLTEVPRDLNPRVRHLDLSMNNISFLPEEAFARLTSLQDLRLASNALSDLPEHLFLHNSYLETLYLQGNQFQSVPHALQNLQQLQQLHLDANRIQTVPDTCFKNMHSLKQLWLDFNHLTKVPTKALSYLVNLEALTLALNRITDVPDFAFDNMTSLVVLLLHENEIKEIKDYAFRGLKSLKILELNKNKLRQVPPALQYLENLVELNLEENKVSHIAERAFYYNRKLSLLQLNKNPIRSISSQAFRNLPFLDKIALSEVQDLFLFPDLTGTSNLTLIRLDRASIKHIPPGLCRNIRSLRNFDVHSNKITMIPDLSTCSMLWNLNLGNNRITSLEGRPFQGLSELRDLTISFNYVSHVPADAFTGLTKLQYLDLGRNQINTIHPSAFLPLSLLEDLNLGENRLTSVPTQGLQSVQKLKTFGNPDLRDFPPKESFPKVYDLTLSYAYHCCDFIQAEKTDTIELVDEQIVWLGNDTGERWREHYNNLTVFWDTHLDNHTQSLWDDLQNNDYNPGEYDLPKEAEIYLEDYLPDDNVHVHNLVLAKPPITCKPKPGPFMPCDDLFGWWSLRCGVWFVFMLALLGNAVVLFVSVTSRSKMDVPRFLICNLACADFFMGVYLGILAIVDASTLGEFRKHAIPWQLSCGCLVAGFLGVLSSELSVFTLTVITLERFYAITNAMQLNKRMSLRQAGFIMMGGWVLAIFLASLPLFGISDYRKFAVCLPFEVEDTISKGYVCFIMIFNGLSFCVILACYLAMYLSIRHSQAWNSNDTRVAKRMALLVFTDFLCWAPIAFLSLAASFGKNLIDLSEAKVLTIFVLPLNSCANPFLYAIFTKQFKRDCVLLCRRLEDTSLARHFSRVSYRHVSVAWGSVRLPSPLRSLVAVDKVDNCSHSVSGGACSFGNNLSGSGAGYQSDPDSGKGSLEYEKATPEGASQHDLSQLSCFSEQDHQGGSERSQGRQMDHDVANAYNDGLTRCGSGIDGGERCGCCSCGRKYSDLLHFHQRRSSSHNIGRPMHRGNKSNCTTETFLPDTESDGDVKDPPQQPHHHHHHSHHPNSLNLHHSYSKSGNNSVGSDDSARGWRHDRRISIEVEEDGDDDRDNFSYPETKGDKRGSGGGGGGDGGGGCSDGSKWRFAEKRLRVKSEIVLPVVSFSGCDDRVDIHEPHSCCVSASSRAASAAGRRGGGGGFSCCSSTNSSPVETYRWCDDLSDHALSMLSATCHAGEGVVLHKHPCAASFCDYGRAALRETSTDKRDDNDSGNDGEGEGEAESEGPDGSDGSDSDLDTGDVVLLAERHGASESYVEGGVERGGSAATRPSSPGTCCHSTAENTDRLRPFANSVTDLVADTSRTGSSEDLTCASQTHLSVRLAGCRRPLAWQEEPHLLVHGAAKSTPYTCDDENEEEGKGKDDEDEPDIRPLEELDRYLGNKHHGNRALICDRTRAEREEVCGLLMDPAEEERTTGDRQAVAINKDACAYDSDSGGSS